jgi:ABC-2 type transport system permease protein
VAQLLKLIQNEWMKLWAKKSSWIILVLMLLITLFPAFIDQMTDYEDSTYSEATWRAELEAQIAANEQLLKEIPEEKDYYEEQIAIAQYQLDHDLQPNNDQTVEGYFSYGMSLISVVSIFAVIIGASIVSDEFSTGTIKMLLTRPVSRAKILTSKLLTVFLYGFTLIAASLALSLIVGMVLYDFSSAPNLVYEAGKVTEQSEFTYTLYLGLLRMGDFVMTILFGFMVGSVFRSPSLAIGLTFLLTFMGALILGLLSRYEIAKYIWIAHTDLTQHETGYTLIDGITMPFSLTILAIYAVIFTAVSYVVFMKRDITA